MASLVCPQCSARSAGGAGHRFCPFCGASVAALADAARDPLVGLTLPGGYLVLDRIGEGPMGVVYRAEQKALGREVAIKLLHPSLRDDAAAVARFAVGARAAALVQHPNSVTVIDFGRTGDTPYLVMELLRGLDAATLLIDKGPPPVPRAVAILCDVLDALAEAHAIGVVHRDVKPENIVIQPLVSGGIAKIVDYGLALLPGGDAAPGAVWGTAGYVAPELFGGEPAGPGADLYACGVILFQMLTACFPFAEEDAARIPPDPRAVSPDRAIPEALAVAVRKALARDAADRFASAAELAAALRASLVAPPSKPRPTKATPPSKPRSSKGTPPPKAGSMKRAPAPTPAPSSKRRGRKPAPAA